MLLHELETGLNKKRKRIGRGPGSGKGKTSGRGHKGSKSRSGYKIKKGFEGGQTPLKRRLPKFGFTNINKKFFHLINLDNIEKIQFVEKEINIDLEDMIKYGLVKNKKFPVKLLGRGKLTKKIKIKVDKASENAINIIKKLGGDVTINKDVT